MSHKSGHVIIEAIRPLPAVQSKPEVLKRLDEIEARDQYTLGDKLYLGVLVSNIADEPAHQ